MKTKEIFISQKKNKRGEVGRKWLLVHEKKKKMKLNIKLSKRTQLRE
jgi:hypothetical protein